jgi:hypothetical protein
VVFREVGVHEVGEVLRLWLRGEGLRSPARLTGVDRKMVRRYVEAAVACCLDRAGGEVQLGDQLLSLVAGRVRPHRADVHGRSWVLLAASGGSLQTSYRQPRPSTTARVHVSVALTSGLDKSRSGGLTRAAEVSADAHGARWRQRWADPTGC